jgi:hypothetical protein
MIRIQSPTDNAGSAQPAVSFVDPDSKVFTPGPYNSMNLQDVALMFPVILLVSYAVAVCFHLNISS